MTTASRIRDPRVGRQSLLAAVVAATVLTIAPLSPAQAGGSDSDPNGLSFQVTPYLWFAGIDGDVATLPSVPTASVEAGFDDIIENTDFAIMLIGEVRGDRFGALVDLIYMNLSAEGALPGPAASGVRVDIENFIGTLTGTYRPYEKDGVAVDLLAGARLWYVDNELRLTSGPFSGATLAESETWVDPVVGVRARADLGAKIFVSGYGDVGGFGAASDLTWQVYGGLGYEVNDWFSAQIGYRVLDVDYENDGFVYDVTMDGPILGLMFRF